MKKKKSHTCGEGKGRRHVRGGGGGWRRKGEEIEGRRTPLSGHPFLPVDISTKSAGDSSNKVEG